MRHLGMMGIKASKSKGFFPQGASQNVLKFSFYLKKLNIIGMICVRFIEKKIALSSISKHVFKEKTLMQDYNLAKKVN